MKPSEMDQEDLAKKFMYHPPKNSQPERYAQLRAFANEHAELIEAHCPPSRERAIAMTKLEEVSMWANASIARNE